MSDGGWSTAWAAALASIALTLGGVTATSTATRTATACVADYDTCNPPPVDTSGPCGEWWPTAESVGWDSSQRSTLLRVVKCESQCNPSAHNRSGASGLMQIMPMWWRGRDPYDPATSFQMGLEVLHAQGWHAWSCF